MSSPIARRENCRRYQSEPGIAGRGSTNAPIAPTVQSDVEKSQFLGDYQSAN